VLPGGTRAQLQRLRERARRFYWRLTRNLAPRDVLESRVRPSDVKRVPDDFEISGLAVENLDPERDRAA
jgi:hypothetical protein